MDLYIYGPTLAPIGVIDEISSLLWTRNFREPGTFALEVPFSAKANGMLTRGNFVRKADSMELRRIDSRAYARTGEDIDVIRVSGQDALGWASWRVLLEDTELTGNPSAVCADLVRNAIGESAEADRMISFLRVTGGTDGYDNETFAWKQGTDVLSAVTDVLQAYDIGFDCELNASETRLSLSFRASRNRTAKQTALHPAVFRPDWGTLGEHTYTEADGGLKTFAYAMWQPPDYYDADLKIWITPPEEPFTVTTNHVGAGRREIMLSTYEAKTLALAKQMALLDLTACVMDKTFAGNIDTSDALVYKTDFDLGDRVTIIDETWGVSGEETITRVEERYDDGVLRISATFGDGEPNFNNELIRMIRRART